MYNGVDLASFFASDPRKYAILVGKVMFTIEEWLTCLLTRDPLNVTDAQVVINGITKNSFPVAKTNQLISKIQIMA